MFRYCFQTFYLKKNIFFFREIISNSKYLYKMYIKLTPSTIVDKTKHLTLQGTKKGIAFNNFYIIALGQRHRPPSRPLIYFLIIIIK